MPDQDIFNKRFSKGWASPAKKICKGVSPEIAARSTARALSSDLKEVGGIRNLPELCDMIIKTLNVSTPNTVGRLLRELRGLEQNSQNRQFVAGVNAVLWETYSDYSTEHPNRITLFPTAREIAERFCWKYIETQLHSRIEIDEAESTGHWQNEHYQQEYKKYLDPDIREIAKSLTKDPDFNKPPRLPRVREKNFSTEKMLHKPISLT